MLSQIHRWTQVITRAMNDEQRARYLPEFLSNDSYFVGGAMTEPGVGSDSLMPNPDPQVEIDGRCTYRAYRYVLQRLGNGRNVERRAEFELRSFNFVRHGHPVTECDLMICWEHDWSDCPLEVFGLRKLYG